MTDFTVEDIVLLIHGEIATAVTSAEVYGSSPGIKLSNVRVRMGQSAQTNEDNKITLNTERFPPAEKGWLIDVSYSPTDTTSLDSITDKNHILPSYVSQFLATTSVDKLSGIGKKYKQALSHFNIKTIQDLAELLGSTVIAEKMSITHSQLRRFQSLAHQALSVPTASIPNNLISIKLGSLLELLWFNSSDTRLSALTSQAKSQLLRWLQQLELCLDNDFFNHLSLKDMLKEP
ncbi:hypothetical protein GCM10009123_12100 [Kangiella japonica]|uniref:Uncharacterized protein n=1 Tax=Kangiella japonica TaxID=647384 RepID=A0ABP3CI68_9GAMM